LDASRPISAAASVRRNSDMITEPPAPMVAQARVYYAIGINDPQNQSLCTNPMIGSLDHIMGLILFDLAIDPLAVNDQNPIRFVP
jgi:hypothetical protein